MKHIKIDFHFVREQVAARQLRGCVISSQDQIADLLTKALPRQRFQLLRSKLNVLLAFHLRGGVKERTHGSKSMMITDLADFLISPEKKQMKLQGDNYPDT